MHASGFPESLCVVVPLHCVRMAACVRVQMLVCFHFCISVLEERERERDNEIACNSESAVNCQGLHLWSWSTLALLYHQRLPAVAVAHKCTHTHTKTCTFKNIKRMNIFTHLHFEINTAFLFYTKWPSIKSGLLCRRRREIYREG